jgi:cytochrome P450
LQSHKKKFSRDIFFTNFLTSSQFHQTLGEIILANTDLTYAALGWSVVHCAQYPEVQSTLAREIYNTSRDEPITSLSKLNEIKYAFMVMNESARLRPALNLAMPEKTVRDVTIMNGYLIPKDVS